MLYLIWSNKRNKWWKPNALGYTEDMEQAGRFSQAEAIEYVIRSANSGIREQVSFMVAAPETWTSGVRIVAGPGPLKEVLINYLGLKQQKGNG